MIQILMKPEHREKLRQSMIEKHKQGFKPRLGTGKGFIKNGYKHLFIYKGKVRREHRLIWEENYGIIPEGCDIHHLDGNKLNNNLNNLQLIKHGEHTTLTNLKRFGRGGE